MNDNKLPDNVRMLFTHEVAAGQEAQKAQLKRSLIWSAALLLVWIFVVTFAFAANCVRVEAAELPTLEKPCTLHGVDGGCVIWGHQ